MVGCLDAAVNGRIDKKGRKGMATKYNRLDKDNCACLLVDHQVGLFSLVADFKPIQFKNNVMATAALAKFFKLPTVLTTSIEEGPNGPMLPELLAMHKGAPKVDRPGQINAFDNEEFVAAVKKTGKKQLLIFGIVTEVCVGFCTLSAIEAGYDVFVVTDASGTFNCEAREGAWMRMTAAGAQLLNWFGVACELHRDWRNDMVGLATLCGEYIPAYANLMTASNARGEVKAVLPLGEIGTVWRHLDLLKAPQAEDGVLRPLWWAGHVSLPAMKRFAKKNPRCYSINFAIPPTREEKE